MSLTTIYEALQNRLDLGPEVFELPGADPALSALGGLFADGSPFTSIALRDPDLAPPDQLDAAQVITVTGRADIPGAADTEVQLRITEVGGADQFELIVTLPDTWTLEAAFPLVSGIATPPEAASEAFLLDRLGFINARLTGLATNGSGGSWSYEATCDVNSATALTGVLAQLALDGLAFAGPLRVEDGVPLIDLTANLAENLPIGLPAAVPLALRVGTYALDATELVGIDALIEARVELELTLPLNDPNASELRLSASVAPGSSTVHGRLFFPPGSGNLALAGFAELVGGEDLASAAAEFPIADALVPREVEIEIDLSATGSDRFTAVGLHFAVDETWEPLPGLSFDRLGLSFEVSSPLNAARRTLRVLGQASLDVVTLVPGAIELQAVELGLSVFKSATETITEGTLDATLALGDSIFLSTSLSLPVGDTWSISLDEPIVLEPAHLARLPGGLDVSELPIGFSELPALSLDRLDLAFRPGGSPAFESLGLSLHLIDPWEPLGDLFRLAGVSLSFDVDDPTGDRDLRGSLTATLQSGDLSIDAAVVRAPGASTWELSVAVADLELPSLADLSRLAGAEIGDLLPEGVANLEIGLQDLEIEADLGRGGGLRAVRGTITVGAEGPALNFEALREGSEVRLRGSLQAGAVLLELQRLSDAEGSVLLAEARGVEGAAELPLSDLLGAFSSELGAAVPEGMALSFHRLGIARITPSAAGSSSAVVGSLGLAGSVTLADLPLVGELLPANLVVGAEGLGLLALSTELSGPSMTLARRFAEDALGLPPAPDDGPDVLGAGVSARGAFHLGTKRFALEAPLADGASPAPAPTTTGSTAIPADAASRGRYVEVERRLGPLHLRRVGLAIDRSSIALLFDAALEFGPVVLSLDGLAIGTSLERFEPRFALDGLGLSVKSGAIQIEGAFLRRTIQPPSGPAFDEFSGAALIRTKTLTLGAIGSYARPNGRDSMFVYAILDYPLGGPSFFFVTGLAAGFGYNRRLVLPEIEGVADFPLVTTAMRGPSAASDLTRELDKLQAAVPIADGELFFALGVRFTSFKIIDSFVLLVVSVGKRFSVDVIGISSLEVPSQRRPGKDPLARIRMALRARFVPDEGFLGVQAQLTPGSFVLSPDCRLQGGFAFSTWMAGDHAGDFVTTMGGYHPRFRVPDHYPTVPRLGFDWQVDAHLFIKGRAYYALMPSALMAGGSLEATYRRGGLRASFGAGADFLIAWEPFYYDIHFWVRVSASYTFKIIWTIRLSIDIGADVHCWGPDFSGTATLDLDIVSVDVDFGPSRRPAPRPISFEQFRAAFLPRSEAEAAIASGGREAPYVGVAAPTGLLAEGPDWIVQPGELTLAVDSRVPVKSIDHGGSQGDGHQHLQGLGVAPTAIPAARFASSLQVGVFREIDGRREDLSFAFEVETVQSAVPAALWGQRLLPDASDDSLIEGATTGLRLRPRSSSLTDPPEATRSIDREVLLESEHDEPGVAAFAEGARIQDMNRPQEAELERVLRDTARRRIVLLDRLGFDSLTEALTPDSAFRFTGDPLVGRIGDPEPPLPIFTA